MNASPLLAPLALCATLGITATAATATAQTCGAPGLASGHQVSSSDSWGNSQFGAGYSFWAGMAVKNDVVAATPTIARPVVEASLPADYFRAGGHATGWVRLFGSRIDVVNVEARTDRYNGNNSSHYELEVLGMTLAQGSINASTHPALTVPFFSRSRTFMFPGAPFPVVVEGTAAGQLGVDASATLAGNSIQLNATPYARAFVEASVGIGVECLSVGVRGELTAFKVSVPVTATAAFSLGAGGNSLAWSLDADLKLSSLDGSISLYGSACGVSASTEIFSWDGFAISNTGLLSRSGCFAF